MTRFASPPRLSRSLEMMPESHVPGLFLFDIDGTLMRGATEVHRASFEHAYRTVYGLSLTLDGIPPAGRTDTWLLAEPLRRLGMPDEQIWARMPDAFVSMQDFTEKHLGDIRDRVLPGVPDVLAGLRRREQILGLITGNLSRIAMAKLRHAGLGEYFQTGGFGEESEVRAFLVPVALASAGRLVPANHAVVIGDTPLDIEAGKEHGTRTVGVATGTFSADELRAAEPDLVFDSFTDAETSVAALMRLVST